MARPLNHDLNVVVPRPPRQFGERAQLSELRFVVGVGNGPRTQPVAKRKRDIVVGEYFAELVVVLVEEAFLVVCQAPPSHDGAAAGHDAGDAIRRERHIGQQHPGVNGHVVDALFGLLNHGIAEDLPGQRVGFTIDLLERLIDRHGADGHGRVPDNPLARGVDVVAGREVHHGVGAPLRRPP